MFAFLLNPGGRKHKRRSKRRSAKRRSRRSVSARRSYLRRRVGAVKSRYKSLARRLMDRYICAPGATRRWLSARKRCPAKLKAAIPGGPSWEGVHATVGYNRKRRRRRNSTWVPAFASNPRRRRRARFHYRSRNTSWVPAFAMNGLGVKSLTTGYQPDMLMKGAVTLLGFAGNALVTKQISGLGFMPGFVKSGPGSYALGLASAGLTGALVGLVAPKYAVPVVFGGVMQQIVKAYNEYLAPKASFLPKLGSMDDYATVADVQNARPLGCLFGGCGGGMGAYNPVVDLFNPAVMPSDGGSGLMGMGCLNGNCMDDYLTVQNAADARPLGQLTVQDALDARPLGHLGYTMNDAVIESTSTEELGSL